MESWQKVWRDGVAPCLTNEQLQKLRRALVEDDKNLIQGATTSPPPLSCCRSWPCEAACAIGFCGWEEKSTIEQVENFFGELCYKADQALGEPAAIRYFLNWFDDTPRDRMRRELGEEVSKTLSERGAA